MAENAETAPSQPVKCGTFKSGFTLFKVGQEKGTLAPGPWFVVELN